MGDIINYAAQLSDLKEIDYRNTLAIASIIEILIEKGVIGRDDIAHKANALERMTLSEIRELRVNR
jgi:hypothetical protein